MRAEAAVERLLAERGKQPERFAAHAAVRDPRHRRPQKRRLLDLLRLQVREAHPLPLKHVDGNHVGDRNETLPTVNGFDEFLGNLYHLNAEEEPELPDYPKDPAYRTKFGPRGVLRCKATDKDDPTVDPRFGRVGKQTIEDTGPLTKKRMETIDDETSSAAIDFITRQNAAGKPFFCWFNSTRMHLRTHVRAEHRGRYQGC